MSGFPDFVQSILGAAMQSFGTPFVIFPIDSDGVYATVGTNQCGVFDDNVVELDLDAADEFTITSHSPRIGVNLCDFIKEPKVTDRITRESIRYEIIEILRDGQGGVELRLHELDSN